MKTILSVFLILLQNLILTEAQTCAYSRYGSDHTMCKYKAKACPPGLLRSSLTQADITAALAAHNMYRNKVATGGQPGQPKASNIEEMKWDPELAMIAQRWADQCSFGHDRNRRSNKFTYVGQNVAITSSTARGGKTDFRNAVAMWYNEVIKPGFSSTKINPFQYDAKAGHYTQVMWATSNRIGCGFSNYKSNNWYSNLYVCNYGPGGNIYRGSMYKPGNPASNCNNGKSTSYPGLCRS